MEFGELTFKRGFLGEFFLKFSFPMRSYYKIYQPVLYILPTPPKPGNKIIPMLNDQRNKNEELVKSIHYYLSLVENLTIPISVVCNAFIHINEYYSILKTHFWSW